MPKSRRRQRPSATPRSKAPVTWQAAVLSRATCLLDPSTTRHDVEVWASALLSEVATGQSLLLRRVPRDAWVAAMLWYADRRRTPTAAALVLALGTVLDLPQDDRAWPAEVLSHLPWTQAPALYPNAVKRGSDSWEDQQFWFLEYPDHVLLVRTRRVGFTRVTHLQVVPGEASAGWDALAAVFPEDLLPHVDLDPDEALAALAGLSAAQRHLLHWQGVPAAQLGHLLDARLRGISRRPEPMASHEQRAELLSAFATATGLSELLVEEACEPLLDYAESHMDGDPLLWSPPLVEDFLLDWMPASLDDVELLPLMPSLTWLWVTWALMRRGLAPVKVLLAADVALDVAGRFRSACEDELVACGFEPDDFPIAWRRAAA